MKRKSFIVVTALTILITSCQVQSSEAERNSITKALQGSTSESIAKQMDVNDLGGCDILIEQGSYNDKTGKITRGGWNKTGVSQVWLTPNSTWETHSGIGLDHPNFKSYKVGEMADKNQKHSHKDSRLVYLGPWKYVEKLGKQIRLISIQENDLKEKSGAIRNFYESLDSQNQKIPEMSLKLLKPAYGDEFCILKWHINMATTALQKLTKDFVLVFGLGFSVITKL